MATTIRIDLQNHTAVVECETSLEAAVLLAAIQGARPTATEAMRLLTSTPTPEPENPPQLKPTRRLGRKPRAPQPEPAGELPRLEPPPSAPDDPGTEAELAELTRPKKPREDLVDPDLPRCERKGTKMYGAGTAALAAFNKSQDYPLEQLAEHIYGSGTFAGLGHLRHLLEQMTYSAKTLRKVGPKSYALTPLGREALERALAKRDAQP